MDAYARAVSLLPEDYRQALSMRDGSRAEELRLRRGRRPTLLSDAGERVFSERICTEKDLLCVLEKASGASLHAVADTLRQGYLCTGGVRIGVCGTLRGEGAEGGFLRFGSLALRIPRECRGIARELLPALRDNARGGTLILSPPGGGKTTFLRECIRCLSDGGLRVAAADERYELSGGEEEAFDLGGLTDLLCGCDKAQAVMLLLRCMNPQLIAMDEITRRQDLDAVREIAGCGVGILASAHAASPEQMRARPLYRELLREEIFSLAVCIEGSGEKRRYRLQAIG